MSEVDRLREALAKIAGVARMAANGDEYLDIEHDEEGPKYAPGTASGKGNRWVERILSLKETCRLHAVSTYYVLVDAVSSFFCGQQPDLAWLQRSSKPSDFNPVIACGN
jgi:hypothetical protein